MPRRGRSRSIDKNIHRLVHSLRLPRGCSPSRLKVISPFPSLTPAKTSLFTSNHRFLWIHPPRHTTTARHETNYISPPEPVPTTVCIPYSHIGAIPLNVVMPTILNTAVQLRELEHRSLIITISLHIPGKNTKKKNQREESTSEGKPTGMHVHVPTAVYGATASGSTSVTLFLLRLPPDTQCAAA